MHMVYLVSLYTYVPVTVLEIIKYILLTQYVVHKALSEIT